MDGFINLLKPPGMTSHDVVAWCRRLFNQRKIGHAGTLDPGVTGVLPIALGKGTRLLEYFLDSDKSYRCEIILGVETTTQDLYGDVLSQNQVSREQLERFPHVLREFLGEQLQVPPMVSAVRWQGKRLYDLAREGTKVAVPPRRVRIAEITLLEVQFAEPPYRALFDVTCSKGTYIRTLCHDLGRKLGCGASLSFLVRTRTGPFKLEEARTLEEIQAGWEKGDKSFLVPLTGLLPFPRQRIGADLVTAVRQGKRIPWDAVSGESISPRQLVQLEDAAGLVAVAQVVYHQQRAFLQPRKVIR
ncbi:MAG TPA: tRNA pseudouridine(55) synthase TruB [Clostridia bacterium]|nr:tRNA pseudouridine(55) synthase TruB [Clostridia bacterium]